MTELVHRNDGCDKIETYNVNNGYWEVYDAWEFENLPNPKPEIQTPVYLTAWTLAVCEEIW